MSDMLAELVSRFEEYGLHVEAEPLRKLRDDGRYVDLVLSRGGTQQAYAMQLNARPTLSNVAPLRPSGTESPPLLIGAESVSARSADAFRRAGIQFIDLAGNASIQFGDVLIDVRGRRADVDPAQAGRGSGGNLFSTARAQVAFVLLQWPRLWTTPQREIAEAAGVSLGQVNDALRMFRRSGFGPGGHRSSSELLDLWVAAFPNGLGRKLTLAAYRGSIDAFRKVDAEDPVFAGGPVISGELVVDDLLRPATLTLYVAELDPRLPVKNRWRSDGDGNIVVRRKFWTPPRDESHDYDGPLTGVRTAPTVLVYADLMASDDPRVRSVAPEWRRRFARDEQDL